MPCQSRIANRIIALFLINLSVFTSLFAIDNYRIGSSRLFDADPASLFIPNNPVNEPNDTNSTEVARINGLTQKVVDEGRFIDRFDQAWKVQYPVGLSAGNGDYVIILENDEITPQGAFLNAVMSIKLPNGKTIAFKANKIPLTAEGGLNGVVELALINSEFIKISDDCKLWINGLKEDGILHTRVQFDCDGFKALIIDASLEMAEETFALEDKLTGKTIPGKVTCNFITTIESLGDLLVTVNLPPFQYKPLKDFGFELKQATLDLSDLSNSPGVLFPQGYIGLEALGGLPELWRGLFIKEAVIRLPQRLGDSTGNARRTEIYAENFIIDDYGFSGFFGANNIIPIEKGSLAGWAYSLDNMEVEILTGSLKSAAIAGKLNIPIMDSSEYMAYGAFVDYNGNFVFTASMPKDINVSVFAAQMSIDQSSTITIQDNGSDFAVSAKLNGAISINASLASDGTKKKGFSVSDLTFENMIISSANPYFKPGTWSLDEIGVSTANGFSLILSAIHSFEQGNDIGIGFTVTINLAGEKYCAAASIDLIGTRYSHTASNGSTKQKLKFKRVDLKEIYIKVVDQPISLEGYIAIYREDPVYGDGFQGSISATVVKKFGVKVHVIFGEVDNYKYWYADAFATFPSPIPIFSGVALYGIGGGVYQHMKQKIPEGVPFAGGANKSTIVYVPDNTVGMGFKATVAIGSQSPKAFNAIVTLEISFNSGGGLREIAFYGDGVLMKEVDFTKPIMNGAPISANVHIAMDFNNDVLHGTFKVYVNAADGLIKGSQANNLAGEMVVHYEKSEWYIHVGKPSCRIGLELSIYGITIKNGSYMMMGTQIESMPPPPNEVLTLLNRPLPENRNVGEIQMAKGFAFGTYFNINSGDQQFLIFYANLNLGVGFDVMLSDKGETYCQETGKKIGVNGWYAEGQLYAFIQGAVGIKIKVFKIKVEQEIFNAYAATLLEAKLPNPYWMKGAISGSYRLLGGRVKGSCNFQFELGNQCTLITVTQPVNEVEGLQPIADLSPEDGRGNVDVFSTPQVVFNYQINKPFALSDDLTVNEKYKIVLDYFKIKTNGTELNGSYQWNSEGDVLVFNPLDILPGNAQLQLEAKVHFEKEESTGWKTLYFDGVAATQVKTISFTTGEAPDYIPENNVALNYPMFDMMNFYKNEFSDGIIQLRCGQSYLFNPGSEWVQYGRFVPVTGGNPLYVNFSYNPSDKKVTHGFPVGLINNTVYRFELVNLPAGAASQIDANIVKKNNASTGEAGDISIQSKEAEGERTELEAKVIYTCYFRTSKFNTLAQKIQSITKTYSAPVPVSNSVFHVNSTLVIDEPFDKYELEGANGQARIINIEALTEGKWLKETQKPLIYDNYPMYPGAIITYRTFAPLGFIPLKAVSADLYPVEARLLTDEETMYGNVNFTGIITFLRYSLSITTHDDWSELSSRVAVLNFTSPQKTKLLSEPYPSIMINSTYPVEFKYYYPGGTRCGTTAKLYPNL